MASIKNKDASTAPPSATPMSFPTTVLALSLTGMLVVGQLYTVIPLYPLMAADWGNEPGTVAWTATAFAVAYAIGFLFVGPAADRFGPRRTIVVGLTATAMITAAVPLASSLGAGLVLRTIQGLVAAAFAPSAFAYIATHVDAHRRVTAITWLTSSFLASAVLGQLAAQTIAQAVGWKPVFFVGVLRSPWERPYCACSCARTGSTDERAWLKPSPPWPSSWATGASSCCTGPR